MTEVVAAPGYYSPELSRPRICHQQRRSARVEVSEQRRMLAANSRIPRPSGSEMENVLARTVLSEDSANDKRPVDAEGRQADDKCHEQWVRDPNRAFRLRARTYPPPLPAPSNRCLAQNARPRGRSLIADGLQQLRACDVNACTSETQAPVITLPADMVPRGRGSWPDCTSRHSTSGADESRCPRYRNASAGGGRTSAAAGHAAEGVERLERPTGPDSERRPTDRRATPASHSRSTLLSPPHPAGISASRTCDSASPDPLAACHHSKRLSSTSGFPPYSPFDSSANPFSYIHDHSPVLPSRQRPFLGLLPASASPAAVVPSQNLASQDYSCAQSSPITVPPRQLPSPAPLTGRYHERFEIESHFPFELGPQHFSPPHRPAASREQTWPAAFPTTSACTSSAVSDVEHLSFARATTTASPFRPERNASPPKSCTSTAPDLHPDCFAPSVQSEGNYIKVMKDDEHSSQQSVKPRSTASSNLAPRQTSSHPASPASMSPARTATAGNLQLPLPRFHPAVYQSPNSSGVSSPSGYRGPAGRLASPQHIQRSVPQQQLYQYQRELIANVTRTATMTPPVHRDAPKTPNLHPCGSPGPATPLALEDNSDYLSKGRLGEGESRELVEKIIRDERERRSGLGSQHSSPAVSPAGGRG